MIKAMKFIQTCAQYMSKCTNRLDKCSTVNFLNIPTHKKFVVITLKFELWLYHRVMSPNNVDGMANNVDPDQTAPRDQTAPLGAV